MSDQCKYCSLRGDIDKCLAQDCKQDYWIVDYLLKEREKIKNICDVAATEISLGLYDSARATLHLVLDKR